MEFQQTDGLLHGDDLRLLIIGLFALMCVLLFLFQLFTTLFRKDAHTQQEEEREEEDAQSINQSNTEKP